MEAAKLIVVILDMIVAVVLTIVVMLQSSKSEGLSSAIAGSSDSFMAKGGSQTLDAKLGKLTKWIGLAFIILSLLSVILISASAAAPKRDVEATAPAQVVTEAPTTTAEPTEAAPTEAAPTEAVPTEAAPTEAAPTTEAN